MEMKTISSYRKIIYIILGTYLLLLLTACAPKEKIAALAKEDPINTRTELYQLIEKSLKKGKTEVTFQTTELDQTDLDGLNNAHDGFYGTVKSYKISTIEFINLSTVTLQCEISDNYYVEKAILDGKEIPEERIHARKLEKLCRKLVSKIGDEKATPYRKEKRIHDYLVRTIAYGYRKGDKGADSNAYTSYGALVERKAVCNGYAQAMKLLCDLSDIECEMIAGVADGENHAWNLVKLGESWYHVDTTWDDPTPDDPDRLVYHYFNVDDTFIAADHSWDKDGYPKADSMDYNYYVINELVCDNYQEFKEKCEKIISEDHPECLQIQVKDYKEKRYSEENLQFLFRLSGADSMNLQTIGKGPRVTLYIRFS